MLEAFAAARRDVPHARLTIVGGLPAGTPADGVHSTGPISRASATGAAHLAALFRSASFFVLPSHYEPFGIVFLEAMAAGLACIGTTTCAMPEIIGDTGALVRPCDPPALAAAMRALFRDEAACAELGRRARRRYQARYGWDRVADRMLQSVGRLMAEAS